MGTELETERFLVTVEEELDAGQPNALSSNQSDCKVLGSQTNASRKQLGATLKPLTTPTSATPTLTTPIQFSRRDAGSQPSSSSSNTSAANFYGNSNDCSAVGDRASDGFHSNTRKRSIGQIVSLLQSAGAGGAVAAPVQSEVTPALPPDAPEPKRGRPRSHPPTVLRRIDSTPQRFDSAPQQFDPAPQPLNPTPQWLDPAPQRLDHAPKWLNPTPKRLDLTPQRLDSTPQRLDPAPQRLGPAPQRTPFVTDPESDSNHCCSMPVAKVIASQRILKPCWSAETSQSELTEQGIQTDSSAYPSSCPFDSAAPVGHQSTVSQSDCCTINQSDHCMPWLSPDDWDRDFTDKFEVDQSDCHSFSSNSDQSDYVLHRHKASQSRGPVQAQTSSSQSDCPSLNDNRCSVVTARPTGQKSTKTVPFRPPFITPSLPHPLTTSQPITPSQRPQADGGNQVRQRL